RLCHIESVPDRYCGSPHLGMCLLKCCRIFGYPFLWLNVWRSGQHPIHRLMARESPGPGPDPSPVWITLHKGMGSLVLGEDTAGAAWLALGFLPRVSGINRCRYLVPSFS